jgi:hypothetical protein
MGCMRRTGAKASRKRAAGTRRLNPMWYRGSTATLRNNHTSACHVVDSYLSSAHSIFVYIIPKTQQMNTKQYMFYVNGLNLYPFLLSLNCCGRFLMSVFFWERDSYLSKISWPIVYWVIDKDISVKTSFTLVQDVTSILYISTATKQFDFISRWSPIVATSTIWILVNQILLWNHQFL